MASEQTVVGGSPVEWREFENEDYDPAAEGGSEEDTIGALIAERTSENPFGIIIVADPVETVSDDLLKRLSAQRVPTKIRREASDEHKTAEKKAKKHK